MRRHFAPKLKGGGRNYRRAGGQQGQPRLAPPPRAPPWNLPCQPRCSPMFWLLPSPIGPRTTTVKSRDNKNNRQPGQTNRRTSLQLMGMAASKTFRLSWCISYLITRLTRPSTRYRVYTATHGPIDVKGQNSVLFECDGNSKPQFAALHRSLHCFG